MWHRVFTLFSHQGTLHRLNSGDTVGAEGLDEFSNPLQDAKKGKAPRCEVINNLPLIRADIDQPLMQKTKRVEKSRCRKDAVGHQVCLR